MIILGSKSPRRKEILTMAGIDFIVAYEDVDENINETNPSEYVKKVSLLKAETIMNNYPNNVVLCADTIVVCMNKILGKPHSKEEAFQMIKMIQGRTHNVITGVFLGNKKHHESYAVTTQVSVSKMTDDEINEYINTDEPYDKAGAYAIQGLFGKYIEWIHGDYYNVMGLPINSIVQKLMMLRN